MKKIIITGAASLLGEYLVRTFYRETDYELFLISTFPMNNVPERIIYKRVDTWNPKEIKQICLDYFPDVVINCVSINDIEECEKDHKKAWELNVDFFKALASASKIREAHYIGFSSESVFDMTNGPNQENDIPKPWSYFSKTKIAAENICKSELNKFTLFRNTETFGKSSYGRTDLISKFMLLLSHNVEFYASDSMFTNPLFADDAARAVLNSVERDRYGFYHLGGKDYLSHFQIAGSVAKIFGYDSANILKQNADGKTFKSGLVNLKAETDLRIKFSDFENALISIKLQTDSASDFGR